MAIDSPALAAQLAQLSGGAPGASVLRVQLQADGRSLARALRVAGRLEPRFVDEVGALPQAIADTAQAGDVVLCMGAGSIGAVPARVLELLSKDERETQEERGS